MIHLCFFFFKEANRPYIEELMWGLCSVVSLTVFRYFVTLVDDYSRMSWLYFMKNRPEVFSNFHAFCVEIHTQFHIYVQTLRSDNAKG